MTNVIAVSTGVMKTPIFHPPLIYVNERRAALRMLTMVYEGEEGMRHSSSVEAVALLAGLALSPVSAMATNDGGGGSVGDGPMWYGSTNVQWALGYGGGYWIYQNPNGCYWCWNPLTSAQSFSSSETLNDTGSGNGTATFSVGPSPEPYLSSSASTETSGGDMMSRSEGDVRYWEVIVGPAGQVPVEMTAKVAASVFTKGDLSMFDATAEAYLYSDAFGDFSVVYNPWNWQVGSQSGTLNVDTTFTATVGVPFEVEMHACAAAVPDSDIWYAATASASVDPDFFIPSYVLNAGDYSVVMLTAPLVPTPELSTWAMLAVGFAGLGVAGWRKGRVA